MTTVEPTAEPNPTATDDAATARRLLDAINRRDVDVASSMLSPDYRAEWPDAELDLAGAFEREIAMMTGIPDTHFGVRTVTATDDGRVLVEATVTGTHTGLLELPYGHRIEPTGRAVKLEFLLLMRFEDGLAVHERLFFDHQELIQQLSGSE